ncbi:MAG: RNA polymerase sigma factor [Verrucomicrobiota bacterium]
MACNEHLPVQEARAGEPDAWDTLFKRYQLPLYVYVFELVRDEQTSLDIVQETFVSASRYIHGLHEDEKFGSWLFSIAHQRCIQRWRKQNNEETSVEEQGDNSIDEADGPLDLLIKKEQEEIFMNLVHQLPLPQRSVLLLFFVEDFSLEEIASITGAQIGTVKSRMHYAKKAFRKLYEEQS